LFELFPEPALDGVGAAAEMIGYLGDAGTDAVELENGVGINLFPRSGHFAPLWTSGFFAAKYGRGEFKGLEGVFLRRSKKKQEKARKTIH
jgi:hypothetical protein